LSGLCCVNNTLGERRSIAPPCVWLVIPTIGAVIVEADAMGAGLGVLILILIHHVVVEFFYRLGVWGISHATPPL